MNNIETYHHGVANLYAILETAYRRQVLDIATLGSFTESEIEATAETVQDEHSLHCIIRVMKYEGEIVVEKGLVRLGEVASATDDEVRARLYANRMWEIEMSLAALKDKAERRSARAKTAA